MSLTRTVPPGVLLLFQSSGPCTPSLAAKNAMPFTSTNCTGGAVAPAVSDDAGPGFRYDRRHVRVAAEPGDVVDDAGPRLQRPAGDLGLGRVHGDRNRAPLHQPGD